MSIVRGPRPKRGWTDIDNKLLRNKQLSFKARGILSYILSHTEHWATDADSIAKASDKDGRTAVLSGLKELELAGYVVRRRRQNAKGQWRTDSYVFDKPVPPDIDIDRLLAEPELDADEINPDAVDEDPTEPESGNLTSEPESGFPTSGDPGSATPTSDNPPVRTEDQVRRPEGGTVTAHGTGRATPKASTPPRQGWDEFGPLAPRCPEHVGVAGDPPCRRCADHRCAFERAELERANAADQAATQALLQEQNASRARRTSDTQTVAGRVRAALRAAQATDDNAGAAERPSEPPEVPGEVHVPDDPSSLTSDATAHAGAAS